MSQLCVPLLLTSLLAACKLQEGPHQLGLSGLGSVWPGATLISSADCGGCGSDHPNLSQHPSALNIDRGGIFLTFESNLLHSNVPILPSLCPPSPLRLFFFLTFFFPPFSFLLPTVFPPQSDYSNVWWKWFTLESAGEQPVISAPGVKQRAGSGGARCSAQTRTRRTGNLPVMRISK